jgi:DNA repair photolyase
MSNYTDPLAWSGQFAHCSLPLRLDSFRGCGFSCTYCFARARGGNVPERRIVPARDDFLLSAFSRADNGSTSVVAQALRRRIPIHFGGMSDPFQPAELHHRVTLSFLRTLSSRQYPTVVSTKGDLIVRPEYLNQLLSNPHTVIQVSLVGTSDHSARQIEPSATPPSRLLRMMEILSRAGINVTCRLQPYLPSIAGPLKEYVATIASTGAKQISIEHLKIPLEATDSPIIELARKNYKSSGAIRDGREYVLTANSKQKTVLLMRQACHEAGLAFGCADNEFQYLSDSWACCSGVDLFSGFENYYRFQIAYAIRRSAGKDIQISVINKEWRPTGSIDRYLNSKTRQFPRTGLTGTVQQHIIYRWNFPSGPGSPASFSGVISTCRRDSDGNLIYAWSPSFINE